MKKQFKTLTVLLAALTLGLTGCSKDEHEGDNGGGNDGKETSLQIKVVTSSTSVTREAGTAVAPTVDNEAALNKYVYVFVFRDNGTYEYGALHPLTRSGSDLKTPVFKITEGQKYVYVFSDPASIVEADPIVLADQNPLMSKLKTMIGNTSLTRVGFEKQVFEGETTTTVTTSDGSYLKIASLQAAVPNADTSVRGFVNSTLWGVTVNVKSDTKTITMDIGRSVAKIVMDPIDATTFNNKPENTMKGVWSDFRYTVGSVALKTNYVGQFEGTYTPSSNRDVKVISAVHESAYNSTDFANYSMAYDDLRTLDAAGAPFYVNENTTKRMVGSHPSNGNDPNPHLFYGNTTYIRFVAKYTPHLDEYCDPADVTQPGDPYDSTSNPDAAGSFYTAVVNGQIYVFGSRPVTTGLELEEIEEMDIKFYYQGVNLFQFPVRDRNESGLENQCRILRNHMYKISVNTINQFGEPSGITDQGPFPPVPPVPPVIPPKPIDEEVELDVKVEVLQWSQITQDENL